MTIAQPDVRPRVPHFSSGPCAKRPGYDLNNLKDAALGRSHRSKAGKAKLKLAIDKTREILGVPDDYLIGITPASDTGAFEMAMWTLLGERGVDVLAWESFGSGWVTDIVKELKLEGARVISADYGELPDLTEINFARDIVFTWNGTTSGVRVPDGEWIPDNREGLTLCDATSAVFAQDIAWDKLDVTTFSWQKVLGGEAQHGLIILSPRAVARLESYTPAWPVPKLFRLAKKGKVDTAFFEGSTINTPSMLCVEDYLDALSWAESVGGLPGLMARADANAAVIGEWVKNTDWVAHLADKPANRSNTSVCLKIADKDIAAAPAETQAAIAKQIASKLEQLGVALDIGSYRDAPPGLRIWAGATVEKSDLEALMPWLDWAFATVKSELLTEV
ncbi:MAG TPA: phosphoserine transaminase [Hyphomicrobiales bacterium]|nr:phosphoserine transaminase [Hyphomicrobiales bacterium]